MLLPVDDRVQLLEKEEEEEEEAVAVVLHSVARVAVFGEQSTDNLAPA